MTKETIINIASRAKALATAALLAAVVVFAPLPAYGIVLTYDYETSDGSGVSDPTTKLSVSKLDEDSHDAVKGATLAILDRYGNELVRWNTSEERKYFDRYLNPNTPLNIETEYILRELEAPEGYAKAEDTHFMIDQYGTVQILDGGDAETVGRYELNLYDVRLDSYRDVVLLRERAGASEGGVVGSGLSQTGDRLHDVAMLLLAIGGVSLTAGLILVSSRLHRRRS